LLTEGEVFENEILSRTESTDNPAQKMPEGNSHGENLIGTSQIELVVKLLILRVFDLLANDRTSPPPATSIAPPRRAASNPSAREWLFSASPKSGEGMDDYLELFRARRAAAAASTHRKSAVDSGA
jgi:hypothetical protein